MHQNKDMTDEELKALKVYQDFLSVYEKAILKILKSVMSKPYASKQLNDFSQMDMSGEIPDKEVFRLALELRNEELKNKKSIVYKPDEESIKLHKQIEENEEFFRKRKEEEEKAKQFIKGDENE